MRIRQPTVEVEVEAPPKGDGLLGAPPSGPAKPLTKPMLVLEFMEKEAEKDTVVFRSNRQSRVTHPPVDIEIWQGSRITRPFVEPPERQTGLKIACKTQKSQNFRFNIENFPGVTPNFGRCRNVEMVFGVTRHTQCRFERNTTVILLRNPAPDGNPPMPRQTSGDYQITGGASYFREQ